MFIKSSYFLPGRWIIIRKTCFAVFPSHFYSALYLEMGRPHKYPSVGFIVLFFSDSSYEHQYKHCFRIRNQGIMVLIHDALE